MVIALMPAILVVAAVVVWAARKADRNKKVESWPGAEATIQSAEIEKHGGRYTPEMPCFAFSYVVNGEYYSGRFSLSAKGHRADELMSEMIGRKVAVQFDPKKPAKHILRNETIEDCRAWLVSE